MLVRYSLQDIAFEWDSRKAEANRRKHGVDFELACEAFFDPFLRILDAGGEGGEARQAVLGLTVRWQLLTRCLRRARQCAAGHLGATGDSHEEAVL